MTDLQSLRDESIAAVRVLSFTAPSNRWRDILDFWEGRGLHLVMVKVDDKDRALVHVHMDRRP